MSLVLDEFALILHLEDVYWSGEGQLSVEAVTLTAACLGLALVGFSPFGIQGAGTIERTVRLSATVILVIDGGFTVVCALKGKYRCALFGLFVAPIAWVGAVRLARPASLWARRWYRGERLERATRRTADFDRRWSPVQTDWVDFIGGRPSPPSQPPARSQPSPPWSADLLGGAVAQRPTRPGYQWRGAPPRRRTGPGSAPGQARREPP